MQNPSGEKALVICAGQALSFRFAAREKKPVVGGAGLPSRIQRQTGLARKYARLRREHIALQQKYAELKKSAGKDPLTGLNNKRCFYDKVLSSLSKAARHPDLSKVAFFLVDIDHFKRINDTYGHKSGDLALQQLAACLQTHVRAHDVVGRWGGEEFGLFLNDEISAEAAFKKAEQIRKDVASLAVETDDGRTIAMTVSIGLVTAETPQGLDLRAFYDLLFKKADDNLYEAKNGGRNRTVHEELFPAPARVVQTDLCGGGEKGLLVLSVSS